MECGGGGGGGIGKRLFLVSPGRLGGGVTDSLWQMWGCGPWGSLSSIRLSVWNMFWVSGPGGWRVWEPPLWERVAPAPGHPARGLCALHPPPRRLRRISEHAGTPLTQSSHSRDAAQTCRQWAFLSSWNHFTFFSLREREMPVCCSTYLCIPWLIFVCALTGDRAHNLGLSGRCSSQRSCSARPSFCFVHQIQ